MNDQTNHQQDIPFADSDANPYGSEGVVEPEDEIWRVLREEGIAPPNAEDYWSDNAPAQARHLSVEFMNFYHTHPGAQQHWRPFLAFLRTKLHQSWEKKLGERGVVRSVVHLLLHPVRTGMSGLRQMTGFQHSQPIDFPEAATDICIEEIFNQFLQERGITDVQARPPIPEHFRKGCHVQVTWPHRTNDFSGAETYVGCLENDLAYNAPALMITPEPGQQIPKGHHSVPIYVVKHWEPYGDDGSILVHHDGLMDSFRSNWSVIKPLS